MKHSGFLSTSLLALLLSTSLTMASATDDSGLGNDDADTTVTTTPAPVIDAADNDDAAASSSGLSVEEQKYDKDGDGKLSWKEKLTKTLDFDGDGSLGFGDVPAAMRAVFDHNKDGQIEYEEVIQSIQGALGKVATLTARIIDTTTKITGSGILDRLPASIADPLKSFLDIVNQAAIQAGEGINIGGDFVDSIDGALDGVNSGLKHGSVGDDVSADELNKFKKDTFEVLELTKHWYNTGNNEKKVNKVEKKLGKL